jgi:hypothetical protein
MNFRVEFEVNVWCKEIYGRLYARDVYYGRDLFSNVE